MAQIQYEISLSDMLLDRAFQKAWSRSDDKEFHRIMFLCGMDTTKEITVEMTTHRNRQNKVVTCERFIGLERQDNEWMRSPYCSQENKISSCEGSLADELNSMSQQGFSGKFESMAKRYVQSGGGVKLSD